MKKIKNIEIYVDGACRANGTKNSIGGYAVIVYLNKKIIEIYSKREENTTNNICEMKAILYAMVKYGKFNPIVYSDSAYAINSFTTWRKNWKFNNWRKADGSPIKNLELIQAFDDLEKKGYKICLKKVKGHSNCEGNIIADKIAVAETTRIKDTELKNSSLDF